MPRPPRAKVASRVAKPTVAPQKQQTRAVTTRATKVSEIIKSFSDDSDGLVTNTTTTRSRRGGKETGRNDEAEFTMTGALPAEDATSIPSAKKRTPVSKAPKRARTTRAGEKESAKKTSPPDVIPANIQSPTADDQADESSGFGDLTFSSLGSDSPAHGTRPPSAIKVGATPAHEKSILALTNFKRRARQPSLLRMVQQTTDVEDNDRDSLDDTENFDFDDFLPHAESTPLNVRKAAPEEENRNDSGTQISSSGSRGTKRKLSPVVQVPRSSPPCSPTSGADIESIRSPSPSLPEVLPSREEVITQTQDDEEPLSGTLAPPMSSSPVREKAAQESPAQTRARRRGRAAKTPAIDISDAEETETPARARRAPKKKPPPTFSTTQLKGLLPRRRARPRDHDEFDLDSSDDITQLDSDIDELQRPTRKTHARPAAGKLVSPKASKKTGRGKKAAPAASKPATKASRTYSRRISSDKENDQAEQDGDVAETSAIEESERLAAIRKKFEEVDAFELDFETVDVTTSSSPFR